MRRYSIFLLGSCLTLLFFSSYIIRGRDSYVMPIDNLDSNNVHYKVLGASGQLFAHNLELVDGMMKDVRRVSLPSEFSFITWLYVWFDDYTAYVVNVLLIHVIAFISMMILLGNGERLKLERKNLFAFLTALLFAALPFWPPAGISLAGFPLMYFVFERIHDGKTRTWHWLAIVLYVLYSNLILSGIFVIAILGFRIVEDLISRRRLNVVYALGLVLMSVLYLGVEYRAVLFSADPGDFGFVSHREEFDPVAIGVFENPVITAIKYLSRGQTHGAKFPMIVGIAAIAASLLLLFKKQRGEYLRVFVVLAIITLAAALLKSQTAVELFSTNSFLKKLQLDRFYIIIPFFVVYLMYLGWQKLFEYSQWIYAAGVVLAGVSLIIAVVSLDYNNATILRSLADSRTLPPSYRQFYAADMLSDVRNQLAEEGYQYAACLGIHPAILHYNGIRTLDGYFANYPLEHKHGMLRVARPAMEMNPEVYRLVKYWGSRLYLFDESTYGSYIQYKGDSSLRSSDPPFDFVAFKELGGTHLLSTRELSAASLVFVKKYQSGNGVWEFYLYRLK